MENTLKNFGTPKISIFPISSGRCRSRQTRCPHPSFKAFGGGRIQPLCGPNCACRAFAVSNASNVSRSSGLRRVACVCFEGLECIGRCQECLQCVATMKPRCGHSSVSRVSSLTEVSRVSRVLTRCRPQGLQRLGCVSSVWGASAWESDRGANPPLCLTCKRPSCTGGWWRVKEPTPLRPL